MLNSGECLTSRIGAIENPWAPTNPGISGPPQATGFASFCKSPGAWQIFMNAFNIYEFFAAILQICTYVFFFFAIYCSQWKIYTFKLFKLN